MKLRKTPMQKHGVFFKSYFTNRHRIICNNLQKQFFLAGIHDKTLLLCYNKIKLNIIARKRG